MTTFTTPSRKGLIFGAVMVALYGAMQEMALQARHFGYEFSYQYDAYKRLDDLKKEVQANGVAHTADDRVLDLMAHTQQTLRVSYEEWEDACPIKAMKIDDVPVKPDNAPGAWHGARPSGTVSRG